MAINPELTEEQIDAWQEPQTSPLGEAERLITEWAAENRYYFDTPLHPNARADLASRIAKLIVIAVKQQATPPEKPARKAKEKV
jgi:hypothetical protein